VTKTILLTFILSVNPNLTIAEEAAAHLIIVEARGGPRSAVMAALIAVESQWRPCTRGRAGEVGLCQIHPCHRPPRGWTAQVDWASNYLNRLLTAEKGNYRHALARYNGGPRGPLRRRCLRYADTILRKARILEQKVEHAGTNGKGGER